MITYTKNKIISDENGRIKTVLIDEILGSVKSKNRFFAKLNIATILSKKLGLNSKQALLVASQMKPDFETFYHLND